MSDLTHGMVKGILWGSVAATTALMLELPLYELSPVTGEAAAVIPAFFFLLLFVLFLVTLAALLLGLPMVALLDRLDCAGAETGALSGSVAGLAVIWAITLLGGGNLGQTEAMFTFPAMIAGGVMGATWGHTRDALADADEWDEVMHEEPASNRQHDRRWLR